MHAGTYGYVQQIEKSRPPLPPQATSIFGAAGVPSALALRLDRLACGLLLCFFVRNLVSVLSEGGPSSHAGTGRSFERQYAKPDASVQPSSPRPVCRETKLGEAVVGELKVMTISFSIRRPSRVGLALFGPIYLPAASPGPGRLFFPSFHAMFFPVLSMPPMRAPVLLGAAYCRSSSPMNI